MGWGRAGRLVTCHKMTLTLSQHATLACLLVEGNLESGPFPDVSRLRLRAPLQMLELGYVGCRDRSWHGLAFGSAGSFCSKSIGVLAKGWCATRS